MYDDYKIYCDTVTVSPIDRVVFGKYIRHLYPHTKIKSGKTTARKSVNLIFGLQRTNETSVRITRMEHLICVMQKHGFMYVKNAESNSEADYLLKTKYVVNGNDTYIKVKLILNASQSMPNVQVTIGGKNIPVELYGFPSRVSLNTQSINAIASFLKSLNLCEGLDRTHNAKVVPSLLVEDWDGQKRLRTLKCLQILNFTTITSCCRPCQNTLRYSLSHDQATEEDVCTYITVFQVSP
jgi:hypothetical protein